MSDTLDTTAPADRAQFAASLPAELREIALAGEPVYTTEQMRELFTVEGFAAPYVLVRRKSDDATGLMLFTHQPRYYYAFEVGS
jgi:hypothetical protein